MQKLTICLLIFVMNMALGQGDSSNDLQDKMKKMEEKMLKGFDKMLEDDKVEKIFNQIFNKFDKSFSFSTQKGNSYFSIEKQQLEQEDAQQEKVVITPKKKDLNYKITLQEGSYLITGEHEEKIIEENDLGKKVSEVKQSISKQYPYPENSVGKPKLQFSKKENSYTLLFDIKSQESNSRTIRLKKVDEKEI